MPGDDNQAELPGVSPVEDAPPAPPSDEKPPTPKRGRGRPRKDAAPRASTPRAPKAPPVKPRVDRLTELLATIGVTVSAMGMARQSERIAYDGQIVMGNARQVAEALEATASENDGLSRALDALLAGSSYTLLVTALAGMLVPIAANHGLIPAGMASMMGAPEPPPRQPGQPLVDDEQAPRVVDFSGFAAN